MASSKGAVFALVGLLVFFLGSTRAVAEDVSVCRLGTARILLLERSGQADEALAEAERVTQQDGFCRSAWMRQAVLLSARKDWRGTEKALQRALRLGEDNTLRLRLAEVFLAQEKAIWARRTLDGLVDPLTGEEQARKNYLLALAAIQQNEAAAALEHLMAVAPEQRQTLPLYDYHLGRVQRQNGERLEARRSLERFLDRPNLDEDSRLVAEAELERTYAQDREPVWTLSATVSPLYDSNVIQEPDGQDTTGGKGPDAFGLGLRGQAGWFPLHLPRHRLGLQAGLSRVFYFEDPADDFALTAAQWQPSYRLRFDGFGRDQEMTVSYAGSLTLLDGGPLAEEESLYVYSESHSGNLRWLVDEEDFGQTTLRLRAGRSLFRHLGRDNTNTRLTVGQSFFFAQERYKLFLEAHVRYEDARREDYDRVGAGPFLGFSALLPLDFSLAASLRYEYLNHLSSEAGRTWEEERIDHAILAGLSVSRAFWNHMDLGLSYDAGWNLSSVGTYDYTRHTIMVNLTGRGAW